MKSLFSTWATAIIGQAIEGASDGALVALFGAAGLQAVSVDTPIQLKRVAATALTGSIYYVCSYLKKFPTPSTMTAPVNPPTTP